MSKEATTDRIFQVHVCFTLRMKEANSGEDPKLWMERLLDEALIQAHFDEHSSNGPIVGFQADDFVEEFREEDVLPYGLLSRETLASDVVSLQEEEQS